ncbi:TPA: hypothetical protein ACH3X1_001241 [Trebouxia sp. C0004]
MLAIKPDTTLGEEVAALFHKDNPADAMMRRMPLCVSRALWASNGILGKAFPKLAFAARRLLSLHATSCAPERNWSHWGNLYRKNRSSLGIKRAEKLVFVSFAAKIANKDMKSAETHELELLCSDVNEASFGNASADCLLIAD